MSTLMNIDMVGFRKKWKDYSDNIQLGEMIRENNGHFWTNDQRSYVEWLTDFGINFTCGFRMGGQVIVPSLPYSDEE